MSFRATSKLLMRKIIRLVTEQQTEHRAFRFVYFRTLNEIYQRALITFEGDPEIDQVYAFMTMFGSKSNPSAAGKLFSDAVHRAVSVGNLSNVSILVQNGDYSELPEVVNIIVK